MEGIKAMGRFVNVNRSSTIRQSKIKVAGASKPNVKKSKRGTCGGCRRKKTGN